MRSFPYFPVRLSRGAQAGNNNTENSAIFVAEYKVFPKTIMMLYFPEIKEKEKWKGASLLNQLKSVRI